MRKTVFGVALAAAVPLTFSLTAYADTSTDPTSPPAGSVETYDSYISTDSPLDPAPDPTGTPTANSHLMWGYEASASNARVLSYHFDPYLPGPTCVPKLSSGDLDNGRGVAYDPISNNLWISRLTGFVGDQKIYQITPPNVTSGACPEVEELLVHSADGKPVQPDFGALDVDQASKQIWAAGYMPVSTGGGPENWFYLINRNNGLVIQSCYIPVSRPDPFNDSLSYFRDPNGVLPGSGEYIVTDAGRVLPGFPFKVIDTSTCHNGQEAQVVANIPAPRGVSGIDFEWAGMISTDMRTIYNQGDFPWSGSNVEGPATSGSLEDVSVCGYHGTFLTDPGANANDLCPYP